MLISSEVMLVSKSKRNIVYCGSVKNEEWKEPRSAGGMIVTLIKKCYTTVAPSENKKAI